MVRGYDSDEVLREILLEHIRLRELCILPERPG